MDEINPWPNPSAERSAETAEQLRALREQADESFSAHRRHLSDIETEINQRIQQIAEVLAHDLVEAQSKESAPGIEEFSAQLKQAAQDQKLIVKDLAQLNEQLEQQSKELTAKTEQLEEISLQLTDTRDQLAEKNDLLDEKEKQLADRDDQQALTVNQLAEQDVQLEATAKQLAELDELLADKTNKLDLLQEEHQHSCDQLDQRAKELEDSRGCIEKLQNESSDERDHLHQQLDSKEENCCQLKDQIVSLENERDDIQHALQEANVGREEAAQSLNDMGAKLKELQDLPDLGEELQQMRRKFELALADVQKLKRQNSDLQEELSHRPEVDEGESPELISLRAERDVLATRVDELESAPPSVDDADRQQEMADLQSRFEMAVDDVRQLKQENAELRQQTTSRSASSSDPASDGPLDWQAQKAQLLASLAEEDGEPIHDERQVERSTIEGTISITDRVVAEKDHEIMELRAQMQSHAAGSDEQADLEQIKASLREELFSNDELIQKEKARLEEAQSQWQDKLREAELALSVERATLAREQAALEEKLAALKDMPPTDGKSTSESPRRRWLAALGIKEDD